MSTSSLLLLRRSEVRVAAAVARSRAEARKHPKLVLLGHLGSRVVVPYAPVSVDQGGIPGSTWDTVDRGPGRKPFLVPGAVELQTRAMTLDVVYPVYGQSVEPVLAGLRVMAARREIVTISYGPTERGAWRLSITSVRPTARKHGTNQVTRAEVALSFTEVSDPPRIALVRTPAPPAKKKPSPKPERVHVFRKGDTCWDLAQRYYGDARKWPVISKRNKIRNVRRIPIGFRAVIPNL